MAPGMLGMLESGGREEEEDVLNGVDGVWLWQSILTCSCKDMKKFGVSCDVCWKSNCAIGAVKYLSQCATSIFLHFKRFQPFRVRRYSKLLCDSIPRLYPR